jgi:Arc/MetJ-type ribon-helix-helix transcriptional regulator
MSQPFSVRLPKDLDAEVDALVKRKGIARGAALVHLARLGLEASALFESAAETRTLSAEVRSLSNEVSVLREKLDAVARDAATAASRPFPQPPTFPPPPTYQGKATGWLGKIMGVISLAPQYPKKGTKA